MEEKKTTTKVGFIVKTALTVALFTFIGALIFRMCQASYESLEEANISPAFKAAYAIDSNVRTHAVNAEFSENGAVYAYSLVYMEKAGYLQFTARYNERHIEEVKETYPDFDEKNIYYELVDANGKVYKPTVLETDDSFNYQYFKLEFTGVDFSTATLSLKMVLGGIDINVGEKSTLVIHEKNDTSIPYAFSGDEKDALGID